MMRFMAVLLGAAVFGIPIAAAGDPAPLAVFAVDAGRHERTDVPVAGSLPDGLDPWIPLRLVEVSGDARTPVACQVEAGRPARLWWILGGKTPAGAVRRFELAPGTPVSRPSVELNLGPRTLDVSFDGARVFRYNHGHVVPPDGVKPEYIRSGYIHPLFTPAGSLLTEDFPKDHHHHKGIWMPWTKTLFEGRHIDFWNLGDKTGTVQFAGFEGLESGPVYGRFRADHEFVDLKGGKVVLREVWDVRTWAIGGPKAGSWIFDLTSAQKVVAGSPLLLEEYRYGGLGFRGPKEWKDANYELLTSEGKTKRDGHGTRARWCVQWGALDGVDWTINIICHPTNERFPEHQRIWDSGGAFFSYSPVQAGKWEFRPGEEHVFRYRFVVRAGKIDRDAAERDFADFAEPPAVRVLP